MITSTHPSLRPSRLLASDVVLVGLLGLRARRLRVALSALGIAIGVGAMVAVLGISESSKAELIARLDQLGTNLLRVAPGQTFFGESASLPKEAPGMLRRAQGVVGASAVGLATGTVRRSSYIPLGETNAIAVTPAETNLLDALEGSLLHGVFLNEATARYPVAVLGHSAARRLGIAGIKAHPLVVIAGRLFAVAGILRPFDLAPELDSAAMIGFPVAKRLLGFDESPTTVYVRTVEGRTEEIRSLLGPTANPAHPYETTVSRPSDALEARIAAQGAFTALFVGLGAVALLVGGVGIANVMVISVLERRSEIGLRRALGATRRHIRVQFLAESLGLAAVGGGAGVMLGGLVTLAYAHTRGWSAVVPIPVLLGGVGCALVAGAVAGLYPAIRASRLSPTEALRAV